MGTNIIKGTDGVDYIVSTKSDLNEKVYKIDENYIYFDADNYTSEDELFVGYVDPLQVDIVKIKDVILLEEKSR